jgi:hypothetical protein
MLKNIDFAAKKWFSRNRPMGLIWEIAVCDKGEKSLMTNTAEVSEVW